MLASLYFVACKMLDTEAQILWSVATVCKCHITSKSLQQLFTDLTKGSAVMQSDHAGEELESRGTNLLFLKNSAAQVLRCDKDLGVSLSLITVSSKFNYF